MRRWLTPGRETLTALLFLAPWIVGFTVFIAGPTIASLVLGFTRFDILRPPKFVGLGELRAHAEQRSPILGIVGAHLLLRDR